MSAPNPFIRLVRGVGRGFDVLRKVLHFVLLFGLFMILLVALSPGVAPVPGSAALVIAPAGTLVDQLTGDPWSRATEELLGEGRPETLTRDVVDAINAARTDKRIHAIALDLDGMGSAGLTKLTRIADALDAFRQTDKPVIAYGDFYSQGQYYLAAHASEVYLHPSGGVLLQGFGRYRMYFAETIEKLSIDWNVFKVGEYKSFVEPYIRNDMSPQDRAASQVWLGDLWRQYVSGVAAARGIDENELASYVRNLDERVADSDGDLAAPALQAGLVDGLKHRDEVRDRLSEIVGSDKDKRFKQVHFADYVAELRLHEGIVKGDRRVAVVVASGEILDGEQPPGTIGGDSLAEVLRHVRNEAGIKAVVLSIDSPGGSKFASEIVQREIKLLRKAGKPVVASMSSVAASGGYYIAMDADEIWAQEGTITGSIGIGAFFPTFQRSLDRLGVHVDGTGTTPWAGDFRPDRELGAGARRILQTNVENGYREFVQAVADARNMSYEAVDEIARGRVWSGQDAHELGLVDVLGGLEGAIVSAASRAGLGDDYDVQYVEKTLTLREALALGLFVRTQALFGDTLRRARSLSPASDLLANMQREIARIARFNDPKHLYLFCNSCGAL